MIARLPVGLAQRLGLLGRWLVAQDPRRLCRRLELEGFEHLVIADEGAEPLLLSVARDEPWPVVLWVVGYYRGPMAVQPAPGLRKRDLAALSAAGITLERGEAASRLAVLGEDPDAQLLARCELRGEKIRVRFTPIAS